MCAGHVLAQTRKIVRDHGGMTEVPAFRDSTPPVRPGLDRILMPEEANRLLAKQAG